MRKLISLMALAIAFVACNNDTLPLPEEEFNHTERALLIACEGNYGAANASLSSYTPSTKSIENEVFLRANGQLLGDVAQSLTMHKGLCWIASNNSGVLFAIDPTTYKEVGRILIPGPRHIHFLSDEKAYVTQIWDSRIAIVNPSTYTITGYIETEMDPATASSEQMVQVGKFLYVNCWSYQRQILKIDTELDRVVATLEVDIQPADLVADKEGNLWTLCDGGQWDGNPLGYEAPTILKISTDSFTIAQRYTMQLGEFPAKLRINAAGDSLYWLNNGGLWRLSIEAKELPAEPLFPTSEVASPYGLMLDPESGDYYISDAIDYTQPGRVVRYSATGEVLDHFQTGICPSAFTWK